jgi:hypothetical protein
VPAVVCSALYRPMCLLVNSSSLNYFCPGLREERLILCQLLSDSDVSMLVNGFP